MAVWYFEKDCNLDEFKSGIAAARASEQPLPYAADRAHGIPIYACDTLRENIADEGYRSGLMQEWSRVLTTGAGIVVLKGCYANEAVIDMTSKAFEAIMAAEASAGKSKADHFGASGANGRIWNALEKLCLADPELFVRYYSNILLALICETWLGPNYQMTSQTNLVFPGSKGQIAHRDYHMGFQKPEEASYYPAAAHHFSQHLTLQGAIAHCHMPIETGPTKYLPYSQTYGPGYIAVALPEFRDYFDRNYVQVPLAKGDAVFFNPAVFHGAGENTTRNVNRLANLLQISSAFGRAMEKIDRTAMCVAAYPSILSGWQKRTLTEEEVVASVAAVAEGYPFPTNLDLDPPVDGAAPPSQADVMLQSLERGLKQESFVRDLHSHANKRA